MNATIHKEDEAAIHALFQRLGESWERGDGQAFGEAFDAEADYVVYNGTKLKGRTEIAAMHQQLFDTLLKGTRLGGGALEEIRFLRPDVALIYGSGSVLWPGQSQPAPEQRSIQSFLLVKNDGQWRITAFQNTRIQPFPQQGGGMPPGIERG